MSKIIPVNITTTEQAVTLDATYQFVWLRNMGENDCLLSDHSGIVAGDDDVMTVKAGESGRIATSGRAVYIKAVSGTSTGEIHAQNFSDAPFRNKAKGGGQSITVEPLTVNDNGVYTAPTGKAYSPVTVDVQEQPWQPLEDGYSNFWFELTNDTLSPWLNFSAKNANATIDWGDGSGEQALTTLTPTHTYNKAGRYIVKVKGVTGIAAQQPIGSNIAYNNILKNVELNNDVTLIDSYAFQKNVGLENIIGNNLTTIYSRAFDYCGSLKNAQFNNYSGTGYDSYSFEDCVNLRKFTVGNNVAKLDNGLFYNCVSLTEIHFLPTVPPTLGSNVFQKVPNSWIGYVPVGYGDTYKSATGWSSYASHILEEGR